MSDSETTYVSSYGTFLKTNNPSGNSTKFNSVIFEQSQKEKEASEKTAFFMKEIFDLDILGENKILDIDIISNWRKIC